jgi:predicted component of viral defense system (DUF524 family)
MEKIDIARIECRATDGSPVATVALTPDMDDGGRVELSPLIHLAPEVAAENGETEYQLRENGRYYYDLERNTGGRDLRLRCHLARRRLNLKTAAADAGRIETGNFCGTLLLEIVEDDASDFSKPALATALVDVRSIKLDYRSEYRGMLRSLATRMADLVADSRSSAKASFLSTFEERDGRGWFQVQLELLREVVESAEFSAALQRILTFPHERLEQELEQIPVERTFKWTAKAAHSLVNSPVRCALPTGHPLRAIGLDSVAARIPVVRKAPTVDTPENRFIKHALRDFHGFASRAETTFKDADGDWSAAADVARRLALNLEQWLSRPHFKAVDDLDVLPLGSPVLQRKAGYREVLRWWLRFRTAAELSWEGGEDMFRAGQRNVAELYEYWLFFNLLDWFCGKFNDGAKPPLDLLIDGLDEDSPNLRLRRRVPLGPFTGIFSDPRRRLHAAFSYNRQFDVTGDRAAGGSWTRKMHPDYTLTFWPAIDGMTAAAAAKLAEEQELLVHIHLDAKYRVENLDALFGGRASDDVDEEDDKSPGNYKRQDLLKMHAYRDAIKRSEGAYVLYPGDDKCRVGQFQPGVEGAARWPHTMWGFHEILPGLGAFAIAPDENGDAHGLDHLAKFLDEVLVNLCNRASFRERRAANLHESLREGRSLYGAGDKRETGGFMLQDAPELDSDKFRVSSATDTTVLVGWFNSTAEKDWMLTKGTAVLRLGNRRGSLPLIKSLAAASHILLHGHEYETVPGLFRILAKAGEVWTRTEVLAAGFPTDSTKPANDIFAMFSVAPHDAFKGMEWDGRRLEEALLRYRNRQRPAYKRQLTKLHRERAKPHLVSLADLQLALITR